MAKNLPRSISDVLNQHQARPFDSAIKETLKEPGVLRRLWAQYCQSEAIKVYPKTDSDLKIPDSINWLDKEFRTKQATWNADLIARIGRSSVLHVEQQTSHNDLEISRRMMLYSAQISTYYDFKKRVFQLYYYTGDPSMIWQNATVESAVVINSQASIVNKFLAIDAGDHDAESMLASGDFNFAVLGLLARNIENPTLYARKLVD